ncbi:hypothetical protein [Bacillus sp. B15-48]|uniref:hypothetical protein n=1 Tax=Bacillus sp. B15-48 TaxID=1548601 RepID=UPI00193F6362|nr:hypothetical protein [Bacillus sp. B15-48]MBM4763300.1 hypothetical protein [Bacillus sp. B15-48]
MAINLPHIEDLNRTIYIPPVGNYETFADDHHYNEKVKAWGFSTTKKQFWYKDKDHQRSVSIIGYQEYGETDDFNTIIIEFQDGNLSCIHPAFLKEMQSSNFGKVSITNTTVNHASQTTTKKQTMMMNEEKTIKPPVQEKSTKKKNEKTAKLELPEDKVHFTATVKQFALTWNHFNESNDEVIVLENVMIEQENPIEIGLAWCAHSKTLKKFELSTGDQLEFDGKIVKKKLAKGKEIDEEFIVTEQVLYKVNNPSKLKKT